MHAVIGALGQARVGGHAERHREGIAKAKQGGRYKVVCRPRGELLRVIRLKEQGVRSSEIASRLGIGRASVYRVLSRQTGGDRVLAGLDMAASRSLPV